MPKIKVAIIGSCVTREAFITRNNPNYKEYYEVGPLAWQSSIVSFMSPPVDQMVYNIVPSEEMNTHSTETMTSDMEKTSIQRIAEYKPDYLIIDFYADVRYGIAQIGEAFITNNPNNFRKTDYFKSKQEFIPYHMNSKYNDYMAIFKESLDKFMKWKSETLPETKVILNCFRYSTHYRENGEDVYFVKYKGENARDDLYKRILRENDTFDTLYRYAIEKYNLLAIDNRDKVYYSDGNHPYGVSPWHFGRTFFEDFMLDLHGIVVKSKLEENAAPEPVSQP